MTVKQLTVLTGNSASHLRKVLSILSNDEIDIAENQNNSAKINLKNAKARLESAKQSKNQQIISAQIALDNAKAQLDLILSQAQDLNIKALISGKITAKYP